MGKITRKNSNKVMRGGVHPAVVGALAFCCIATIVLIILSILGEL